MPFRNLKLLMMLTKTMGIHSCKLVNGRLRPSSIWSCCYCMIWFFFHCSYLGIYYYMMYTASPDEKAKKEFALAIVRFSTYVFSLFPYNIVASFWSNDFVKVNASLISYIVKTVYYNRDKHAV